MKKIYVLMAVALVFLFAGCGSAQEEAAPAPEETTVATEAETTAAPETTAAAQTGDIGIEKAIDIALKDAGVDKANANITKQSPDVDDGVNIYEVDFTSGETEYEYDIDAATGKILERNSESIYDD